jgi:hypothetical protein
MRSCNFLDMSLDDESFDARLSTLPSTGPYK